RPWSSRGVARGLAARAAASCDRGPRARRRPPRAEPLASRAGGRYMEADATRRARMSGPADTDPTRAGRSGAVGRPVDRRHFLRTGLAAGIAVTASCGNPFGDDDDRGSSRLRTRLAGPRRSIAPGVHDLFPDTGVEGGLCVPSDYDPSVPVPLIVMLHGYGSSRDVIDNLFPLAETR